VSRTPWSPAPFPGGKRFAFTIMDDTDVATVSNVAPIYGLLRGLGFRTTKTVWPVGCPEGSRNFGSSETLEDPEYREFIRQLSREGFEIAFHGATMESSVRERTARALEVFTAVVGSPPRVHANHSFNRENLYWGASRVDDPTLKLLYRALNGRPAGHYQGHVIGSAYWWGDLASKHLVYARNLSFNGINLLRINPSLPYRDAARPLVSYWFSASDAEDCAAFNRLLDPKNQETLEREGGVSIVATHLGKRFVEAGRVNVETERLLRELATRPGWFVPVGELLDWLLRRRAGDGLPAPEWRRMQWRWFADLVARKLLARARSRSR